MISHDFGRWLPLKNRLVFAGEFSSSPPSPPPLRRLRAEVVAPGQRLREHRFLLDTWKSCGLASSRPSYTCFFPCLILVVTMYSMDFFMTYISYMVLRICTDWQLGLMSADCWSTSSESGKWHASLWVVQSLQLHSLILRHYSIGIPPTPLCRWPAQQFRWLRFIQYQWNSYQWISYGTMRVQPTLQSEWHVLLKSYLLLVSSI